MPLDFEKLKAASHEELLVLALCEFSRLVDAVERMAPEAVAESAPICPCPPELRVKVDAVMGQAVAYRCGLCGAPAGSVEA